MRRAGASEANNYQQMSVSEAVMLTWQLLPDVTDCHIVDWILFQLLHLGCRVLGVMGLSNNTHTLCSSPCRECDGMLGGTKDANTYENICF